MKRVITLLSLVSTFSTAAMAEPTQEQINQSALEILISHSDKLTSEEGQTVSSILAQSIVTSHDTHNKVSNICVYDSGDSNFKCKLMILNADDDLKNRTESTETIQYELEKASDGLPSRELLYLTVRVIRGG